MKRLSDISSSLKGLLVRDSARGASLKGSDLDCGARGARASRSLLPLLAAILLLLAGACTHNGGPSGPLYGRWHLQRIEADNMTAPAQNGEIYWAFQNGMIQMLLDRGGHSVSQTYGAYRLDDNTLFLNFSEERYAPFSELGLARQSELQVLKLTGKEFTLLYTPDPTLPDATLTYYLRKW